MGIAMKKTIIIFLLLSIYSLAQENRLIRQNDLTDSLDAIRTLIGTGGSLPDSVLFSSDSTNQRTFSDAKYPNKYLSNLGTTSINASLIPSTGVLNLGGTGLGRQWYTLYANRWYFKGSNYNTLINIVDPSAGRNIYFPDASGTVTLGTGTANQIPYWVGTNTLGSLALDPATLEINGSNQLTVIGGTGSSGWFGLDGNGDLMPSLTATSDDYYELDGNGDIMPQL